MWNLSKVEDLQDLDKPRDRGVILHDILGDVRKIDDLPIVVARHAYRYNISDEDKEECYRPDRVVWTADGAIEVIDYKFGEPNHDQYAAQVRNYMKLLVEMGYENIKGYIWYLKSGEIVTINI